MIEIEFNDAEVTQALRRVAARLSDLTPLMQEIGELLVATTEQRFKDGKSPEGLAWAPKSEVTVERQKRSPDGYDPRLLFWKGTLASGIHAEIRPDQVAVGSPMIYAATMQFGAAQGAFGAFIGRDKLGRDHFHHIPWGDIPARPFLGISDGDRDAILGIAREYLDPDAGSA